jgi:hypothetical protein
MAALQALVQADPGLNASCDDLKDRMAAIMDEIRHYPTPIAGCDDQFNYLCEKREALAQAIARRC